MNKLLQSAQEVEKTWQSALDRIRQELSEQSFKAWIEPLRLAEFDGTTAVVIVPDKFYGEWIRDHFQEIIQDGFFRVMGEKPVLSFTVASPPLIPRRTRPDGLADALVASPPSAHSALAQQEQRVSPNRPTHLRAAQEVASAHPASYVTPSRGSEQFLNSTYTFENFVVGPGNRLAHAAAIAIADSPARAYNPFFIYGSVGLGKTHLMQGIAHRILSASPQKKVCYITSEKFTNQLISAIQTRSTQGFRNRYRLVDVLLIDDIHFIAGKESTQEEFFHTFNTLYDAHKQIVVSSDRPPREIPGLEERLVSRFGWGLVTDIQPPDFETRVAILKKKMEKETVSVPDEVVHFIAKKIKSNIRELEGALIRVMACSSLTDVNVDLKLAQETLKDAFSEEENKITISLIQKKVADYFNIRVSDMRVKSRAKAVSLPRHIAMYLVRELTPHSLPEIGEYFGGRNHATVIHACQKVKSALAKNASIHDAVAHVLRQIKSDSY